MHCVPKLGCSYCMLRGKFMAISVRSKKDERSHSSTLLFYLRCWVKKSTLNIKACRRKEIRKTKVEMNEIKSRKTVEKNQRSKSLFFVKINKIEKPLFLERKK